MNEKLDEKVEEAMILGPEHPFSEEEEKRAEEERVRELRPIIEELEYRRAKSIYAPVVI